MSQEFAFTRIGYVYVPTTKMDESIEWYTKNLEFKLMNKFQERGSYLGVLHHPHKNSIALLLIETADIQKLGTALGANSKTSLLVKMDNGVRLYSTDSGKTWNEKAPDGVTVSDKDGKITITNGILPKDGESKGLLSKVENGVRSYSTDGGKTWSTTAPDGVTESEDGKTSFMNGTPPSGDTFGTSLQVKMENGVRLYSTDGGKTWSEKAPDGVTVSDKDGKVNIMNGTPPKDGEGKGLLSKVENGVRSYPRTVVRPGAQRLPTA